MARDARPRFPAVTLAAGLAAAVAWTALASATPPARPMAAHEAGEDMPGGAATSPRGAETANAFSLSAANIGFEREFQFKVGNGIFRKMWVSAPASTRSSDGLGPLFNARACQNCHLKDGRGHPPADDGDDAVSMLLRVAIAGLNGEPARPDPVYGGQIQDFAIQGHRPEARIAITYEEIPVALAGGETASLRKPTVRLLDLAHGPLAEGAALSARVANQMVGLGLLEAVADADIEVLADPDDRDGDGISGRVNRVRDLATGAPAIGRFGWKASQPTVRQQSAAAFSGDMGLSTALFPAGAGDCTAAQAGCLAAPDGADPRKGNVEVPDDMLDLVAFYARNLAVPRRMTSRDPDVLAGKALFHAAGCAACHRPSFTTSTAADVVEHKRGLTIWPYTDLLLHDMGDGLADGVVEGEAEGREWRTPPLWGIGATEMVSGHTQFLHDGRARNLTEAILWHGGEAQAARDAFTAMAPDERALLVTFLNSL